MSCNIIWFIYELFLNRIGWNSMWMQICVFEQILCCIFSGRSFAVEWQGRVWNVHLWFHEWTSFALCHLAEWWQFTEGTIFSLITTVLFNIILYRLGGSSSPRRMRISSPKVVLNRCLWTRSCQVGLPKRQSGCWCRPSTKGSSGISKRCCSGNPQTP